MIINSIFGMSADSNFWLIIGIMALATTGMFLFFKYKKWL
jgi:LPXTG-motif cell wall-anchored protein